MCTHLEACSSQWCPLNDLLAEYATPPFTPENDRRLLDAIMQIVTPWLRSFTCIVFHLPQFDPESPDAPAIYLAQEAAEALDRARLVFMERLLRLRQSGHPLVITAANYFRCIVMRVAYWHGPDCYGTLNSEVVSYLQTRHPNQEQRDDLLEVIRGCCCNRLGLTMTGQHQPSEEQRTLIARVADTLLQRFLAGEIWQTGVTTIVQSDSVEAGELAAMHPLPGPFQNVVHVDRKGFAVVADPLLFACQDEIPPDESPVPHPAGNSAETYARITELCCWLADQSSVPALRHLCYLLFRPYFSTATLFCQTFTQGGLPITSAQAANSLSWWLAELLPPGTSINREIRDGVDARMGLLSVYDVLGCAPLACSRLIPLLPTSGRALADFWRQAIGLERDRPDNDGFFVRDDGPLPPDVEPPRTTGDPTFLILDHEEEE